MGPAIARMTGLPVREQWPAAVIGLGHAATHWILAMFLFLNPFIARELGLSYAEAGLVTGVIYASSFAANFVSGALTDVLGRRVLLQVIALAGGAAALAGIGRAEGFILLFACAFVIGATNNLWHPPAISFLSENFARARGYVLAVHAMGASLGDTITPLVSGTLLVWLTWRGAAVWSAVPVAVVILLLAVTLLSRDRPKPGEEHQAVGWRDFFSGMGQLIRNKAVMGLCAMAGFRSMTQTGLLVFLPFYLADALKVSPVVMGFALAGMQVGGVLASPVMGAFSDRVGRRPVVLAGLTGTTIVVLALTVIQQEILFIAGVSVLGFVLFAVRPVVHSWMMDITPTRLGGGATSLMFGVQAGLSMAIPPLGGLIADTWGLAAVFYMLAGTMLVANLLVYILPSERVTGIAD